MTKEQMKMRTKRFGVEVVRCCIGLPREEAFRVVGRQLMRAATSVGANYRAACRGRSKRDFVAKLGIVEEETDEAMYWLEVLLELDEAARLDRPTLTRLHAEAGELLAIVIASIRTARRNG